MFFRKKPEAKNFIVLDVEGGSVGGALMRQGTPQGPVSFLAHERLYLPVRQGRSAEALAREIVRLAEELVATLSREAQQEGGVSGASIIMSAPWGRPNLTKGSPDFVPHMQEALTRTLMPHIELPEPPRFYTGAGAALTGLRAAFPHERTYLLTVITHEMTELLLIHNGQVAGHASMPHGINLPLRTLKTHGGLSDAEARSALKLRHMEEPLGAAGEHYAREFKDVARELLDVYAPSHVWVVSPAGEYFARALAHPDLGDLFPQGGFVRALSPRHVAPHAGNPQSQDLFLVLAGVWVRYS